MASLAFNPGENVKMVPAAAQALGIVYMIGTVKNGWIGTSGNQYWVCDGINIHHILLQHPQR